MKVILWTLVAVPVSAQTMALSFESFQQKALANDPILAESRYSQVLSDREANGLLRKAILPRLRVSTAVGPAPSVRQSVDSVLVGDAKVAKTLEDYDFTTLGPYYGIEAEFAQPLNLQRLNIGIKATRAKADVKRWEFVRSLADKSKEYQESYSQFQYALTMYQLATQVKKDVDKVKAKLQEKLDNGDEDASQNDLLEIEASAFDIEDGLARTEEGLDRANRGLRFLLGGTQADLELSDSLLSPRKDSIPSLDVLKDFVLMHSPELKQLASGLRARQLAYDLKQSELGPEFFLFGSFTYAKSWARDRSDGNRSVFDNDPMNKLEGTLGIGARFDLNLWSKYYDVGNARVELELLKRKDAYASDGILLKLGDAYAQVQMHKRRMASAEAAMMATNGLLKSAAVAYDMDPSTARDMLNAYVKNVNAKKTYYSVVLDFNLSIARLIAQTGATLDQYRESFGTL